MSYENIRRVKYKNGAVFIPVCKTCGRFVKSDETIFINGKPNATCKKCGRIEMIFEGFF